MATPWELPAPRRRDETKGRPSTFIPFDLQLVEAEAQYATYQDGGAFQWGGNIDEANEQAEGVAVPEPYPLRASTMQYHSQPCERSPWMSSGAKLSMQAQVSVSEYNDWGISVGNYTSQRAIGSFADEEPSRQALETVVVDSLPPVTTLPYPTQTSQHNPNHTSILSERQLGWTHSHYEEFFRERGASLAWIAYPDQPPSLVHEDSADSWTSTPAEQSAGGSTVLIPTPPQPDYCVTMTEEAPASVTTGSEGAAPVARPLPKAVSKNDAVITKRPASFDECVTVFETTPGAMTKVKRRRKLDADSHKSFKVTRRIGACLECRFRKRTCSPGSPCEYCVKVFGSTAIAQVTCQRESPFSGSYCVTDYFLLSSKKRIIDFKTRGREYEGLKSTTAFRIHGKSGPCNLSLDIPIAWQSLDSLSLEDQSEIWRTKQRPPDEAPSNELNAFSIPVIPEDDDKLADRLEAWAIKYASSFASQHVKRFPTAHAFHVGMVYVNKKLPEYQLVYQLLRGIALAYILRAGVQVPSTEFRTIQARIDTVIYDRLRRIESGVFAALQKIVWVSAGRLKREQCYPVAYVLWQTMRSTCLRASHVKTLLDKAKGVNSAEYKESVANLTHCFNLLLSVHTALFRSNSPIILDYTDPANHDLLNFDKEFIREAAKLRDITLNFHKGSQSRPFRDSNWYHNNMSKRLMRVLSGKGAD